MTQLEEELLQLIRRWNEDAEHIIRGADEEEGYTVGYGYGLHQAAKELRNFMRDWFCREGNTEATAGMMYRNGRQ